MYNQFQRMTLQTLSRQLLAGKILIAVGMILLICWTDYFLDLVRPIDFWDVSPLPAAAAVVVIGVKLARCRSIEQSQMPTLLLK